MTIPVIPPSEEGLPALREEYPGGNVPRSPSIWRLVSRHRLLVLGSTAALVATTLFFTSRLTPRYQAAASIRVDPDDSRLIDLGVTRAGRPSDLLTEFQVLQSRALLEGVVDSLGLQLEIRAPAELRRADIVAAVKASRDVRFGGYRLELQPDGRIAVRERSTGASLGVASRGKALDLRGLKVELVPEARLRAIMPPSRTIDVDVYSHDDAVKRLQKGLKFRRRPDANILDVSYRGVDPELVQAIPNVLTARFIAARQSEHRAQARSSAKFLREQVEKLSHQLRGAEEELRRFRERKRVVSLPDEASTGVSQLAQLQAKRDGLEVERAALAELVQSVPDPRRAGSARDQHRYQDLAAFPTLLGNQAVAQLLSSLTEVEDRRSELLVRRSPRDADVQVLTGRADELGQQLRRLSLTYLQGLTAQVSALDAVLRQSRQQLDRIPAKELQFARLQRETRGLEEIVTQLETRLKEAEIAEAVEDPSIRLVDAADLPKVPSSPKPLLNLSVALVFGLGLGTVGAFLREYIDQTARSRQDVFLATGASVIGLLPHVRGRAGRTIRTLQSELLGSESPRSKVRYSESTSSHRVPLTPRYYTFWPNLEATGEYGDEAIRSHGPQRAEALDDQAARSGTPRGPRHSSRRKSKPGGRNGSGRLALMIGSGTNFFPSREGYNRIATSLAFARPSGLPKVLVVTSPLPGEGKTTVSVNLAITLAQYGGRVLLLDADLRRGAVAESLGIAPQPGLSDLLLEAVGFREATQQIAVSETARLCVITCGRAVQNPAVLLNTRVQCLLQALREEYDVIVVDTPPINVVGDAAVVGAQSDGVIMVARSAVTGVQALAFATEELRRVAAPLIGTVLNDIDFRRDADYDEAYEYYARGETHPHPTG